MADGFYSDGFYPKTKYEPPQRDEFAEWAMKVRMERRKLITTIPIILGLAVIFVAGIVHIWLMADPTWTLPVKMMFTGLLVFIAGIAGKIVDAGIQGKL